MVARASADRRTSFGWPKRTLGRVRNPSWQNGGNLMYVRITRGRFQPERIDDVEALSSSIAEAIKTLPGFLGYQGGGRSRPHHRTGSAGARRDLRNNDHGLIVRTSPKDIPQL